MEESKYVFRSTSNTLYKWRNLTCFIFCLFLILQGGMVMLFMDTNTALTITTTLIPTYVLIYGLLLLFPVFFWLARLKVFTCDNISAWIVILALALFTSLGIADLEKPSLGYFVTFMPPVALLIVMAIVYVIRFAVELPKNATEFDRMGEIEGSHDFT